ncbi:hypothetical protein [Leifsonia sp. fls2-241-R2A-40a]|uniref:hypothetical protein n=1 Tax=Leifsonia sp. fls2-241-R2A-40a TaxID=3040290 RepID=UPI002550A252|nr:hypothetical protein [Leifsonia sp. fls2-241-R2A-40a]
MKASQLVAEYVTDHHAEARAALHPRFVTTMKNARLSGNEFVRASRGDHAPLTDLRLRRDESSRQMFLLNIRAWDEASPGVLRALQNTARSAEIVDGPGWDVLTAGRSASSGSAAFAPRELARAPREDVYESLLKYVNAFGNWDEAEATAYAYASDPAFPDGRLRGLTSGLAGVVVGLAGDTDTCDRLFEDSVKNLVGTPEQFFVYLRWASLTAKRRGDLDRADGIVDRAEHCIENSSEADRDVALGLSSNLRALFALRRGDIAGSSRLVCDAISRLAAAHDTGAARSIGSPEAARYLWMAELNAAQLDLSQQRHDLAIERLQRLREFAQRHDPGAIHTTLSLLAYIHLVRGDAATAAPLLRDALGLLRDEYDPSVVLQVRKMLYRAYVELGDRARARRVSTMTPYFWLTSDEEQGHDH